MHPSIQETKELNVIRGTERKWEVFTTGWLQTPTLTLCSYQPFFQVRFESKEVVHLKVHLIILGHLCFQNDPTKCQHSVKLQCYLSSPPGCLKKEVRKYRLSLLGRKFASRYLITHTHKKTPQLFEKSIKRILNVKRRNMKFRNLFATVSTLRIVYLIYRWKKWDPEKRGLIVRHTELSPWKSRTQTRNK